MRCTRPWYARRQSELGYHDKLYAERPCGQCLACRINWRERWVARCLMEARTSAYSVFTTYTYSNASLKTMDVLVKEDIQLFLKRLRKNSGQTIRYLISGEFGERTGRPHWHGLIFATGVIPEHVHTIAWRNGFVRYGGISPQSARYVMKYCLKDGSTTLRSLKPGIGANYLRSLAPAVKQIGVIPKVIRIGGKIYPLDRYCQEGLSRITGVPLAAFEPYGTLEQHNVALKQVGDPLDGQRRCSAWKARKYS